MIRVPMIASAMALAAAAPAVLAGAASAQPMPPPMMANGMTAMPTPAYVRTAAQSDEFEIRAAKMALHHSTNPHVTAFASRMIQDHTQSTMMIKAALRESGHMVPPPPPLTPEQDHMLADLKMAGPNFDRVYVDQQVKAHQMALAVHQSYAHGGSDPVLMRAANQIVPVVQMHLQMAQEMQSHMG